MSVRFAPSPTGVFHVGNLRTAWISHRIARNLAREWILRFEDIDGPRVIEGAMEKQLSDMRALGMTPDRVLMQSQSRERHESLFQGAVRSGAIYPCSCSRKEILEHVRQIASAPHAEAPIYDGRCRDPKNRRPGQHPTLAWRFLNPEDPEGKQDFVIARTGLATNADRTEFVPSYHWACAIDDYDGDHSVLVRAWDLEHVIPQQRLIHAWVGREESRPRPYPAVFHCSLIVTDDGHRLEKRTRGVTLDELTAAGIGTAEIVSKFEDSFREPLAADFAPGKILGEQTRELRLKDLGFH